ncbi:MAG: CRISPR-associated endonuclease Cas1 [Acidobacteria bacterium]|nr:CRISPR-associated endonuclease Cas1 [Acidobacteriota bacterium]
MHGRRKHPSPDPLNALLSFTYTLLGQEVGAVLEALGLDPYYGFLHQPDYGRPSLALDLLEPLRHPVGDRLVMTLANKSVLGEEDFVGRPGGGMHLTAEGLRRYLDYYETWMMGMAGKKGWRVHLRGEVERFVHGLRHGVEWKPMRWDAENHVEEECSTLSVTT